MIPLHRVLSDEGFRLFFPLAALHAALWPLLWVALWSFDLPLARDIPPGIWHGYEMIFGAWGAALLGFLTTAARNGPIRRVCGGVRCGGWPRCGAWRGSRAPWARMRWSCPRCWPIWAGRWR